MKTHKHLTLVATFLLGMGLVLSSCGSPRTYWGVEDDYNVVGGHVHYEYTGGNSAPVKHKGKKPKKHKKPKRHKCCKKGRLNHK